MKAHQIISTLAELVSKIEALSTPYYPGEDYAKAKTAALVRAAQELERLSEEEKRAVWDSIVNACDTMLQAEKKLPNLPHIAPITTKLQVTEGTKP